MNIPPGRKIPPPRPLERKETAASLRLWKVHFLNYYRTDAYFKKFISEATTWHVNQVHWGFTAEPEDSTLKRQPAELESDCNMFLNTLASYVPDDYIVEKILKNTTNIASIWKIIDDFYGVSLSSETFLGLAKMHKEQSETYRQFYLRLEGFVSKHLTKGGVKVEDVTSPARGDTLTISIKNIIVITWMQKVHEKFIDCVKVDFSQELRGGKELIELLPRLADNVDGILARHDLSSGISAISFEEEDNGGDTYHVHRVGNFRGGRGGQRPRGGRRDDRGGRQSQAQGRQSQAQASGRTLQCSHCDYLAKTLRLKINTNHEPTECWRKDIAVRLIKSEDDSEDDFSSAADIGEQNSGKSSIETPNLLQIETDTGEDSGATKESSLSSDQIPLSEESDQYQQILEIQRSLLDAEAGTAQAKSPTLKATLHGHKVLVTIDEGSELNCISLDLAKRCSLDIIRTENRAKAADSSRLRLVGQLKKPLNLVVEPLGTFVKLNHVVVVDQLNAQLLLGEPGKRDNDIITYASKQEISLPFQSGRHVYKYEQGRGPVSRVARAPASVVTYPGENYFWPVPDMYSHLSHLQVQPRQKTRHWFEANTCQIQGNKVCLKNTSDSPVYLKKGTAFADIWMVNTMDKPVTTWDDLKERLLDSDNLNLEDESMSRMGSYVEISTIDLPNTGVTDQENNSIGAVYTAYPDQNQYVSGINKSLLTVDHTDKIQLDPDNILTPEQKTSFRRLCQEFKDVIRPEPGRYNGSRGYISNKINFASRPAPNAKIFQQNLSPELKRKLSDKMNILMDWGVLAFPEHAGVKVEFISPSMLVPKMEKGEFRLVTNFCSLNKFIIKPKSTSPTIQEAKDFLARFRYHIHLDLSNFFYQNGLNREDVQFMGTIHPFKGVVVYTCEAQGINGAAEHSYEKITRIFSDFFEKGTMTRMADGLHIGCDTVEEGEQTLRAVFTRARDTGLTFKPSKLEVFPTKTTLFGWTLNNGLWKPTPHTTSALAKAPLPRTIKQLRAYLGSFKQFSTCVPGYGEILTQLESMTGSHIPSAQVIQWTPDQEAAFYKSREATQDVKAYAIPRPEDRIYTYSDFSRAHRAVGGKMEFDRTMPDGSVKRFLGGFYSTMLDSFKSLWWPCEGEALGARLVLQFFERYIRASNHISVHFTDNMPVVDAWKKARRGGFSTNARVSTFLAEVSNMAIEIKHKAGQLMHTSDFASRHPQVCPDKSCALCQFTYEQQQMGENCDTVRQITVNDVTSGVVNMPFTARKAWLKVQEEDKVHVQLKYLIAVGQAPAKKQTKGDFNKLKLLYNLYKKGDLRVESDGLISVKHETNNKTVWATSIPFRLYPGLSQAIHLKFSHPSKNQQNQLMSRYFYCPGHQAIVDNTIETCSQCLSMKTLPKVIQEHKASPVDTLGSRFSSDVMIRNGQKFLVTVEDQSSFTNITEVPDQTSEVLRNTMLSHIAPLMPEAGTEVRTDGAASFRSLELESQTPGSVLKKLNVKIDIGERYNPNKNAQAENKIKEVEKEFLRHFPTNQKLSPSDVIMAARSINSRIRSNGLASREVLLSRKLINHEMMDLTDRNLSAEKKSSRDSKNTKFLAQQEKAGMKSPSDNKFEVGDLVYLRSDGDKNNPRSLYIIHQVLSKNGMAMIKKYDHQLQSKNYKVKLNDLISNSSFRGPSKSADMSQDELEKKENERNILKKENEGKEVKKRLIVKKKEKPAGKQGAPVIKGLNAAGRPLRKAAAKSKYATVSNIDSCMDIKPPFVIEEAESEDEDFWIHHVPPTPVPLPYLGHLHAALQHPDLQVHHLNQAPEANPVLPELDEHHEGQVDQAIALEVGAVTGTTLNSSTDESEYYDINLNDQKNIIDEEYNWDGFSEPPSFSEQTVPIGPVNLPPDWPPRRLSSECHNQLIVTTLTSTNSDYDPYFNDTFLDNNYLLARHSEADKTEDFQHLSSVSDQPSLGEHSSSDTIQNSTLSGNSDQEQVEAQRRSSRIRDTNQPDYHQLHHRGRAEPQ